MGQTSEGTQYQHDFCKPRLRLWRLAEACGGWNPSKQLFTLLHRRLLTLYRTFY